MNEEDLSKEEETKEFERRDRQCCHRQQRHGVLGGVLLLLTGVIFLLNNFNILPWEVWNTIWRFWPLVLVILGFEVIFGRSIFGRIIVSLIGIVLVTFVLAYSISAANPAFAHWMQTQLPGLNNLFQISINARLENY